MAERTAPGRTPGYSQPRSRAITAASALERAWVQGFLSWDHRRLLQRTDVGHFSHAPGGSVLLGVS